MKPHHKGLIFGAEIHTHQAGNAITSIFRSKIDTNQLHNYTFTVADNSKAEGKRLFEEAENSVLLVK